MSLRRYSVVFALVLLPLVLAALAVGGVLFLRQGGLAPYRIPQGSTRVVASDAATIARGEYIARIGNCVTCHTTRGGAPFAGGRAFATGYGTIYSSNLTPDANTGLGDWSADEFAHTMRNGVSRHGVLYPVFPYANFALLADADLDALYAYLHTLPATAATPPPNRLDFPASWRTALIGWRMLYYRPLVAAPSSDRGRYLVDGLAHCAMCHSTRGARGSLPQQGYLAGGRIPGMGWYAPPLDSQQLRRYSVEELAAYLRTGTSSVGTAYGPMAEVVYGSLQALSDDDAMAIARYLKRVPPQAAGTSLLAQAEIIPVRDSGSGSGAEIYKRACTDCHGADGEGVDNKYPPLRDAVSVTAPDPINAVRMVLYGALAASTAGNPQPYSMPPYVQHLSSAEIAAVVNYMRGTWGGQRAPLAAADVEAMYGIVID
ncbi:MAG: c-type cytochrome [Rudaea sp.]|nr:c-type cytochrome [Rudaea sp.]